MDFSHIKEVSWAEARNALHQSDSIFTKIIDEWCPNKEYTLIKIPYQYGASILSNGIFQISIPKAFHF
jgi:hypothetical protein